MAKRSQKTKVKDLGYNRALREIENTKGAFVQVGWFGELATERPYEGKSPPTVVEVATAHEFGYPPNNLPERSTLRASADKNRSRYRALSKRLFTDVIAGKATTTGALAQLGETARTDVVLAIRNFSSPALKEATKRAKARNIRSGKKRASFLGGAGNPLVDTGAMMNAVSWGVSVRGNLTETGGKSR